jgi:hypothetical protein
MSILEKLRKTNCFFIPKDFSESSRQVISSQKAMTEINGPWHQEAIGSNRIDMILPTIYCT